MPGSFPSPGVSTCMASSIPKFLKGTRLREPGFFIGVAVGGKALDAIELQVAEDSPF